MRTDDAGLQRIREALRSDRVVVVPTDTVYGLAVRAGSSVALDALFEAKGRRAAQPAALLRPRNPGWDALGVEPSRIVVELTRAFWPGALTLLVHSNKPWDARIDGGRGILGVRVPNHPWLLNLLEETGEPVAVTSANLSGEPEIRDPGALPDTLRERVDVIVDDGEFPDVPPSAVVDVTGGEPRLVRDGLCGVEVMAAVARMLRA